MALLGRAKQKGQKMERQLTECGFEIQEQAWGEGKGRGGGTGRDGAEVGGVSTIQTVSLQPLLLLVKMFYLNLSDKVQQIHPRLTLCEGLYSFFIFFT